MKTSCEYYHVFYHAAKYRNLTLAADALHNSQPNVSRTIRLLEHDLGCQLLIRSNRGISLTPEGERLYAHVKIAMEQLQAAEDELKRVTGLHEGVVSVGAGETAVKSPMPGNIFKVECSVGQSVNAGDVLVVLEAMKMEIEVSAPVAGTVKAVSATVGTAVNTDDLLVTIG